MEIFDWEIVVKNLFIGLDHQSFLYRFMDFISYPGPVGWTLWTVLLFLLVRRDFKKYLPILILALVAVVAGDFVSRWLVKGVIMRPRPLYTIETCFDPKCWGFVSSHATNVAAFITVLALFRWRVLLWGLPAVVLVSVSRIVILDHYPLDVIGGVVLGGIVGLIVWLLRKIYFQWRTNGLRSSLKSTTSIIFMNCLVGLFFVSTISYASIVRLSENFYEVDAGKFYRSAQLTPDELKRRIEQFGIKTVISLRGSPDGSYWYKPETALLKKMGVEFKSYGLSTDHFPSSADLSSLLRDFETAQKPILVHCRSGADRTGMISALYALDQMKQKKTEALHQLSFQYWHVRDFHPAMSRFIEEYQGRDWALTYDPCKFPQFVKNPEECGHEIIWK